MSNQKEEKKLEFNQPRRMYEKPGFSDTYRFERQALLCTMVSTSLPVVCNATSA